MQGKMRFLRSAVQEQIVKDGVRAGAQIIRDEMRLQAPVLDHRTAESTSLEPGALKADIRSRMRRTDRRGFVEAIIGPFRTAHVAYWLEFGHRLVKGGRSRVTLKGNSGTGREVGEVQPHPFLRRSYETSIEPAREAFAEVVANGIREVLK